MTQLSATIGKFFRGFHSLCASRQGVRIFYTALRREPDEKSHTFVFPNKISFGANIVRELKLKVDQRVFS